VVRARLNGMNATVTWRAPADDDVVAQLVVQGRHASEPWTTVRTISCRACWSAARSAFIARSVVVPGADSLDSFRVIAIDRAGNRSRASAPAAA